MKVLITGANGQLGQSLLIAPISKGEFTWIPTDYPELDITDQSDIDRWMKKACPDMIINCAAYTAVDQAEEEPEKARQINVIGPSMLAVTAKKASIPLIHFSTDYVFPGTNRIPYRETDIPGPLSVYGKTKLEGEQVVIQAAGPSIIIRTSWLYSEFGKNFVLTMLRLGREKDQLDVVMDQIGCPTYSGDLADATITILRKLLKKPEASNGSKIYHFCNTGETSWFDFAKEIIRHSGLSCRIVPIPTKQYPQPATRPAYSVLDTSRYRKEFGVLIPHWKTSLVKCLNTISGKTKQI
ncbi:MAG: dTDP-4-dehydrorhamnose reductase [Bacteroidota bacterium]